MTSQSSPKSVRKKKTFSTAKINTMMHYFRCSCSNPKNKNFFEYRFVDVNHNDQMINTLTIFSVFFFFLTLKLYTRWSILSYSFNSFHHGFPLPKILCSSLTFQIALILVQGSESSFVSYF